MVGDADGNDGPPIIYAVLFIANQRAAGGRKDSVVNAEARGEVFEMRPPAGGGLAAGLEGSVDKFKRAVKSGL